MSAPFLPKIWQLPSDYFRKPIAKPYHYKHKCQLFFDQKPSCLININGNIPNEFFVGFIYLNHAANRLKI